MIRPVIRKGSQNICEKQTRRRRSLRPVRRTCRIGSVRGALGAEPRPTMRLLAQPARTVRCSMRFSGVALTTMRST
ncbi:hypothetical protein [Lysobacter gummosus]|uniref:hypothetical protein n=1 Tax=Lysobacter gummosus TaxID=262324 RepID=UPI003630816E